MNTSYKSKDLEMPERRFESLKEKYERNKRKRAYRKTKWEKEHEYKEEIPHGQFR